ncbi:hypothetical protein DPMN_036015 [Dreissena polymorpha]|uniref:Uncharacterized protein n=1 Tax=Dreissena polymorpha TaxID=45954 RepID=A0A9D4RNG3_DREPO|nr:hypothetical protein DPMN_036015 [Dreissena polymorpha]
MQQPKSIGEAIENIKIFNHIQFACAPIQMGEQEDLRWVHAVGEEPIPEVVVGRRLKSLARWFVNCRVLWKCCPALVPSSPPTKTRDAMTSVRPRIPIKEAPGTGGTTTNAGKGIPRVRVAAVHVGIGTNMPTKEIRPKCLRWECRGELAKQRVP